MVCEIQVQLGINGIVQYQNHACLLNQKGNLYVLLQCDRMVFVSSVFTMFMAYMEHSEASVFGNARFPPSRFIRIFSPSLVLVFQPQSMNYLAK